MDKQISTPVFNEYQRQLFTKMVGVCEELLRKGDKPSVRKLCERLRCAPNTLLPLYQQWQKEIALATTVDDDLSPAFKQAVLAEYGRKVSAVREQLQAALADREEQIKELQEFLQETADRNTDLQATLETRQRDANEKILGLEKRLAAAEAQANTYKQQLEALTAKLENLREARHQAELAATAAKARNDELEKQLAQRNN